MDNALNEDTMNATEQQENYEAAKMNKAIDQIAAILREKAALETALAAEKARAQDLVNEHTNAMAALRAECAAGKEAILAVEKKLAETERAKTAWCDSHGKLQKAIEELDAIFDGMPGAPPRHLEVPTSYGTTHVDLSLSARMCIWLASKRPA